MDELGRDLGRAVTGAGIGIAGAAVLASLAPRFSWWVAVPGALVLVAAGAAVGAAAALSIGDWWDRRR